METLSNFLERCKRHAPEGWTPRLALESGHVFVRAHSPCRVRVDGNKDGSYVLVPMPGEVNLPDPIIASCPDAWLTAEGYPSREDEETGIQYWDDPQSWALWVEPRAIQEFLDNHL